jgi:hypothetical protein
MTTSATPKNEERAARDRLKAIQRARAANAKASARRRADVIRDELSRPRAKDCRCPITPHSTHEAAARIRCQVHRRPLGLPDPRRDPPQAWNMTTATVPSRTSRSHAADLDNRSRAEAEYEALWAMSRSERIDAIWHSQLTMRRLCQWSSRAQHEVSLLGGELAWIAMRTPEWAEITNEAGVDPEEVDP